MPTQPMTLQELNQYEARAQGGWLGKNIGGTLGMPAEGTPGVLTYFYYDPVPTEPQPNDDFEIQLIWAAMLKERGIRLKPRDFQVFFERHMAMTISEYQMAVRNFQDGLLPPMSGAFNNWFIHGMGAAIRSEIWAMLAPGLPDIAAAYAYMDAIMDHAGEGVWGEVFMAALESQAFVESNRLRLLETALRFIPVESEVSRAVRLVIKEWHADTDPVRLRHMLCADFAHPIDFTAVPLNIGFIILGFLYGEDFGDALCLAVNCGYDTDCTGASLGSLLGIMSTRSGIPERWLEPVGEKVVVSEYIRNLEFPSDINELSELTAEFALQVLQDGGLREHLYQWTGLEFLRDGNQLTEAPPLTRVRLASDAIALDCDYLDDPALGYGEQKPLELRVCNQSEAALQLSLTIEPPLGVELLGDTGANGSAGKFSCTLQPHATEVLPFALRIRPDHQHAVGSEALVVAVTLNGQPHGKYHVAIIYKTCWLITAPIAADDLAAQESIEEAGHLSPSDPRVHQLQLAGYSLNELFPEPDQVIYAQIDVAMPEDEGTRVIANNSGPIRVWLDDELIIDKAHRMHGIMPSWHFQHNSLHGYVQGTFGTADVLLHKGWHTFLIRLQGRKLPQDAVFYLAGLRLGPEGQLISERRMLKPFSSAMVWCRRPTEDGV